MSATEEEQQQRQQQQQQHRHRASWTLPCHFHTLSLMNCKSRAEAFAKSLHSKLKSLGRLAGDDDQDEEDDEEDEEERGGGLKEDEIESDEVVLSSIRSKNATVHNEKTRLISAPHHGSPTAAVDGFLSQHGEDELYFDFDISSPESPAEQDLDLSGNRAKNATLVTRQPTASGKSELELIQRSNSKLERCHAPDASALRHFRPEVGGERALDLNSNSNARSHFENSDTMLDCYNGTGAVNGVDEESGCISAVSSVLTEQDNDDEEDEEPFGSLNDFEDAEDASYLWSPPGSYGQQQLRRGSPTADYPTINDGGLNPPPMMTSPVSSPSPCKLSTIVEQATLEESAEELWLWSEDAAWRCCGAHDADDLGQGRRRISEEAGLVPQTDDEILMLKDGPPADEVDAQNAGLDSERLECCLNEMPSVEEPTSRRVRHGEATGRNNRGNHDDIQPEGNDEDDSDAGGRLNEGQVCPSLPTPPSNSPLDPREPTFGCGTAQEPRQETVPLFLGEIERQSGEITPPNLLENDRDIGVASECQVCARLQSSQNGIEKSGERSVLNSDDVSEKEIGENMDSDASSNSKEIVENERVIMNDTEENVVLIVRDLTSGESPENGLQLEIPNQLPECITDVAARVWVSPTPTSLNLSGEERSTPSSPLQRLIVDVTLSPATSDDALSPNPDDEAPRRVRRSSSLKTCKTPPGTPNRKKIVRFADALGLDLEDVKHVFLDDLPTVPSSAYVDLTDADQDEDDQELHLRSMTVYNSKMQEFHANFGPARPACSLVPVFPQPASLPDFIERLRRQSVCLESAVLAGDSSVRLVVRVLNLDFHKRVIVRYTLDEWVNTRGVDAEYVQGSHDGFSDKFATVLNAEEVRVGDRLAFAVQYMTMAKEFWDNNYGQNYCFQCFAEQQFQPAPTDDSWVHFL